MRWKIELLGGLRAELDGRNITRFQTRQAGGLLAYLAYFLERPHPRPQLIEILWPGCDPAAGRDRLSAALSSLRRQLEPPGPLAGNVIQATRSDVSINPAVVATDVAEFHSAIRSAAHAGTPAEQKRFLAQAVELYRGTLLDGYCESWVTEERMRLTDIYFEVLGRFLECLERSGDLDRAVDYARRGISIDPLREEAHLDLMRRYAAAGRPSAALRQYRVLTRLLEDEFGLSPSSVAQALAREISEQPRERTPYSISLPTPPRRAPIRTRRVPAGTVTFLLADRPGVVPAEQGWADSLCRLSRRHRGHRVEAGPDSLVMAFSRAADALAAVKSWQRRTAGQPASKGRGLRRQPTAGGAAPSSTGQKLRLALHTGEIAVGETLDSGPALATAFWVLRAAHPGQTLVSEATAALLKPDPQPEISLADLGLYRARDSGPLERLFQLSFPGSPEQFPPPTAAPAFQGHLPASITRFFGREAEIAWLAEAIDWPLAAGGRGRPRVTKSGRPAAEGPRTRLVTLTGPGGSGKTRLALEVAQRLREGFCGAVWFVLLLDLTDAGLILDKLLATLCLPRSAQHDPLDQVVAALSQQPSLVVLDNFEHLVEAGAPLVRTLLERTPRLTCLVTSRKRLGLPGERELPVMPLPVPAISADARPVMGGSEITEELAWLGNDYCSLVTVPSVALFLDRAQAVRPDFQLTPANAAAVATLCQRLEGLPLALELAAARIWVLTPTQMLARLEERFELLSSRNRKADPRHRSLRAALDWSYESLSPDLKRFFARLSAFRGGWSLDAAVVVCEEPSALDLLDQLRECSLVQSEELIAEPSVTADHSEEKGGAGLLTTGDRVSAAGVRFQLLDSVREYGESQLSPIEKTELARRHAAYFLSLAEHAEPRLMGPDAAGMLDELEREHDNFRTALQRCLTTVVSGQRTANRPERTGSHIGLPLRDQTNAHWPPATAAEIGLRLGAALWRFWLRRGFITEGREGLARLLSMESSTTAPTQPYDLAPESATCAHDGTPTGASHAATAARAAVLHGMGSLLIDQADYAAARLPLQDSLALQHRLGDPRGVADLLYELGIVEFYQGSYPEARSLFEEVLASRRRLGDRCGIAGVLEKLGALARHQGDHPFALSAFAESLQIYRELNSRPGIASALVSVGLAKLEQGDLETAITHYQESLAIARELGDRSSIGHCLLRLGGVAIRQSDYDVARTCYEESLEIFEELGERGDALCVRNQLGYLAQVRGEFLQARMLYSQCLAAAREQGSPRGIAWCQHNLAGVASSQGEHETALALYRESLAIRLRLRDPGGTAECLEEMARLAAAASDPEAAARLFRSASIARVAVHAPMTAARAEIDRELAALRSALGEVDFAAIWADDQSHSWEEAAARALQPCVGEH